MDKQYFATAHRAGIGAQDRINMEQQLAAEARNGAAAMFGSGLAGGGACANASVEPLDRTQLEVVAYRISYQANRVEEIEKELYALVERLNGDAPCPRGEDARNMRSGLLGQSMGSLDELESTISNCAALLSVLRGLV